MVTITQAVQAIRERYAERARSWLSGAARVLDLAGVFDDDAVEDDISVDTRALASDWRAVGDALRDVMGECETPPDERTRS